MANRKNIIAIVYDFDGTLSPLPMQEYTVFPEIGISAETFWQEVEKENRKNKGEAIITYMMLMLKKARESSVPITKEKLSKLAAKITYYKGVETFFERITKFAENESKKQVKIRHYVLSSGLKEILQNVSIKKHFHNIFASEYAYDHYGAAQYPKVVVTDTVKTQYLFRINKGKESLLDSINEYMPDDNRPIPFSNIIYIGDGLTDVPCMTVTVKNGGYAIAVYKPHSTKGLSVCKKLFNAERVNFVAPADYSKNGKLEKYLQVTLQTIIQGIRLEDTRHQMMRDIL